MLSIIENKKRFFLGVPHIKIRHFEFRMISHHNISVHRTYRSEINTYYIIRTQAVDWTYTQKSIGAAFIEKLIISNARWPA